MNIGDRVKIERDEKLRPVRGAWRQYRNKYGTLMEINKNGKGPWEYGVAVDNDPVTAWFKKYEVRPLLRQTHR